MKEENGIKYRELMIEISQSWGPKAERFIFLGIAFFFSWPVFVPALFIHTKIAGLRDSDKDLISFYLPMVVLQGLVFLSLFMFDWAYYTFYFNIILAVFLKIFIVLDIYYSIFEDKKITLNLFSIPKSFCSRKSVKGYTLDGEMI